MASVDRMACISRLACVDLPALPLQLLLRRRPEWRERPVAVVAEENPLSPLLWVNEAARGLGILPGLRYAAGLSLDRRLCAGTVPADELGAALEEVQHLLLGFSPEVEPADGEPGVFWLNAAGLDRLHGPLDEWAVQIRDALRERRFLGRVVVGFTRFGTYSLARAGRGVAVLASAAAELEASGRVRLARLGLLPRLRDDLAKLGVETVADFLALPPTGIRQRFGVDAERLHHLARGEFFAPLQPSLPPEPARTSQWLDDPESDAWRLLFLVKRLLHPLFARLGRRQEAVTRLHLDLLLADRTRHHEDLQPAVPTLDLVLLMELVRLRLENLALAAGVERVALELETVEAPPEALALFRENPRRDAAAGLRALARLRAEFGDEAVSRAALRGGHLPGAAFGWEPVEEFRFPRPGQSAGPALVRRMLPKPKLLAGDPRSGPARQIRGRYRLSGAWWRKEIRRLYHFIETPHGELLWTYFDQRRRRWFLQGRVE